MAREKAISDEQIIAALLNNGTIRAAVFNINSKLQAAIDTVADIMGNEENNPAIRLQAAQTILNNAGKFAQRLQTDETGVIMQVENNRFSLW